MTLSLSKAPLKDTVVELRYSTTLPSQVVAGLLFNELQSLGYKEFEELPIVQLPPKLRDGDEDLKYSAHYRIKKNDYWVSISSTIIAVSNICNNKSYAGWKNYIEEIEKVLSLANKLGLMSSINRASVRFINVFDDENISNEINLRIVTPFDGEVTDELTMNIARKSDEVTTKVMFASKATMTDANEKKTEGSLLDITSSMDDGIVYANVISMIDTLHDKTEETFISVLGDAVIRRLT